MFIDVDKALVEERLALREKISKHKEDIAKLQEEMQKLQEGSKEDMFAFAKVNQQINDVVLPVCLEKLEEYEVPNEVVLKDGKPFLEILDLREDAIKQAKEIKEGWKNFIEKRKADEEKKKSVEEVLGTKLEEK